MRSLTPRAVTIETSSLSLDRLDELEFKNPDKRLSRRELSRLDRIKQVGDMDLYSLIGVNPEAGVKMSDKQLAPFIRNFESNRRSIERDIEKFMGSIDPRYEHFTHIQRTCTAITEKVRRVPEWLQGESRVEYNKHFLSDLEQPHLELNTRGKIVVANNETRGKNIPNSITSVYVHPLERITLVLTAVSITTGTSLIDAALRLPPQVSDMTTKVIKGMGIALVFAPELNWIAKKSIESLKKTLKK